MTREQRRGASGRMKIIMFELWKEGSEKQLVRLFFFVIIHVSMPLVYISQDSVLEPASPGHPLCGWDHAGLL